MRKKNAFIFVNGIRANPGDPKAWTDRAASFVMTRGVGIGEKFEYRSTALFRRVHQAKRAQAFADKANEYVAHSLNLVGHSNGTDIILRALPLINRPIDEIHLISAACEADFDKNLLNLAMEDGRVKRVFVYVAVKDRAMVWARLSRVAFGWIGWGYGSLGAHGPRPKSVKYPDRVQVIKEPNFGHSTWFEEPNFTRLMKFAAVRQRPWERAIFD